MGLAGARKVLILLALIGFTSGTIKLHERFSWNALDYNFSSELVRQEYLISRNFVPENNLPVGIEVWNNKLFVSVPRWRNGIPSTLNYIDLDQQLSGSPALIPYPSLEENILGNCENGLSTVYRIKADKCDRLWVLDTGTFGIENTTTNPCPYAINVFDLKTNKKIRRYEFRPEDTNSNTFIANTAVDIGSSCDDTFAYFADELGYGLIAYSWEQNKSWRFTHSYFFPDPLHGDFNIAGLNFQWWTEGIFGMALSPIRNDGYRDLYFGPLASHREFVVSTKVLRDETSIDKSYHDFKYLDERGPDSHITSQVMDENGIMLYNLIDQNAIGCWNSELEYLPQNQAVVDKDDVGLVFPSDIKIDNNQNVWILSDRMPVFLESNLDYRDINFRIYSAPLKELIDGTICDSSNNNIEQNNKPFYSEVQESDNLVANSERLQQTSGEPISPYLFNSKSSNQYFNYENTYSKNTAVQRPGNSFIGNRPEYNRYPPNKIRNIITPNYYNTYVNHGPAKKNVGLYRSQQISESPKYSSISPNSKPYSQPHLNPYTYSQTAAYPEVQRYSNSAQYSKFSESPQYSNSIPSYSETSNSALYSKQPKYSNSIPSYSEPLQTAASYFKSQQYTRSPQYSPQYFNSLSNPKTTRPAISQEREQNRWW